MESSRTVKIMNALRLVPPALLLAAAFLALPACNTVEGLVNLLPAGNDRGAAPPKPLTRSQRDVISAIPDIGRLVVLRGTKQIAVVRPSKPLIERYGFWQGTDQVVIRSTDNSGEAIIELFKVQGSQRVAGVAASAVKDGKPDWAASVK